VRMRVRERVLVIKVGENSRKWLREGGRVILRACVRERHLGRECVSMCERPPMDIHRVRVCMREKVSTCVRRGLWRVKLHLKD
jgi:hypothetical protein